MEFKSNKVTTDGDFLHDLAEKLDILHDEVSESNLELSEIEQSLINLRNEVGYLSCLNYKLEKDEESASDSAALRDSPHDRNGPVGWAS